MKSIAQKSLEMTGLFEAEILVRLMLLNWKHPFAGDAEFAEDLLETASGVLRESIEGNQVIQDLPAEKMNLIAAVWYAERCAVAEGGAKREEREAWLAAVQKSLPSCFCDPSDLG